MHKMISIPNHLRNRLKKFAQENETTESAIINLALERYLNEEQKRIDIEKKIENLNSKDSIE